MSCRPITAPVNLITYAAFGVCITLLLAFYEDIMSHNVINVLHQCDNLREQRNVMAGIIVIVILQTINKLYSYS